MRFFGIFFISLLILFCILFAVLQTKTVKTKIAKILVSRLSEMNIHASITDVGGRLPFTWKIAHAEWQDLKLSGLKLRIAILPLINGKLEIDYLHIDTAEYLLKSNPPVFKFSDLASLPFPISIKYFEIDRFTVDDLQFSATGGGRIDKTDFALHAHLKGDDMLFDGTIIGDQKQNFIELQLDTRLGTLPLKQVSGRLAAELRLKGPWNSWDELLSHEPIASPISGEFKGVLADAKVQGAPMLDRTWKLKTQFSLGEQCYVQKFMLSSDLIKIKGKGQFSSDIEKCSLLAAFSFPDLSLLSPLCSGKMDGKGMLQDGRFKLSFATRNALLEQFAMNTSQGLIKGSLKAGHWEGEFKLSSKDAQIPFENAFAFIYFPKRGFSLTDFTLDFPDGTMSGYVNYSEARRLFDGCLFANVHHLDRFAFLAHEQNLGGSLAAEVRLEPNADEQNVQIVLIGKNWRYRDMLLDDLTISAKISNAFEDPRGQFNLLVEKFFSPRIYLTRLNFGTNSDELNWPFFLDVEGRMENPFHCFAKGFWHCEKSYFNLELMQLFGDLANTPFALKFPCEYQLGPNSMSLSQFDFHIGKGRLYTTFDLSPVKSLGKWELEHFPLEIFSVIKPRWTLNGSISSKGYIDGTPENLEGSMNAALEESSVLHYGKKEPLRARGTLQAHLNHNVLQIFTDLHASAGQFLDFTASLPCAYHLYPLKIAFDSNQRASAELVSEGKLEDLFDFINLGTNSFTGLISTRLYLSKTLADPSLLGKIEWQNGTYENYFTGISLKGINADFEAENQNIRLIALKANDGEDGTLSMEGSLALKPQENFPYAFDAELTNLHAVGFDMIDAHLTGPLYLTGNLHRMDAQGNLLVDKALIQLDEHLPYEIPNLPVTYVNTPFFQSRVQPSQGFTFHLDLELTAEKNVLVEGQGVNAELEGHVHLTGADTNIAANGTLKLVKGEYRFSGKIFKLTEGEIVFNDKPVPSANLNISGTLDLPSLTITAMMRGPLTSPRLFFQSNPNMPTSSILARILFNKDISDITHPEKILLASTLVSISGNAGPDMMETIRKTIGIDRLSIGSHPGSDEVALQIGKYLTRGVMITLSQSATSSQVIVEVDLPKGFVFQAETQEQQEGKFSLKWTASY